MNLTPERIRALWNYSWRRWNPGHGAVLRVRDWLPSDAFDPARQQPAWPTSFVDFSMFYGEPAGKVTVYCGAQPVDVLWLSDTRARQAA